MESVLPFRYRMKARYLIDITTTKLPILWITVFLHHMYSQTSIENVTYLWKELFTIKIDKPTDLDCKFIVFLQDVVMEWIIEHSYLNTLVEFYFYNYLLLHFKCIPYSTWTNEDKVIIFRYLKEHVNVINKVPILEQMNIEIRQQIDEVKPI